MFYLFIFSVLHKILGGRRELNKYELLIAAASNVIWWWNHR